MNIQGLRTERRADQSLAPTKGQIPLVFSPCAASSVVGGHDPFFCRQLYPRAPSCGQTAKAESRQNTEDAHARRASHTLCR